MGVGKSDHDREAAIKRSREHLKKIADSLDHLGIIEYKI